MPYRTGDYPDGFCSVEVDSLRSLIKVARDGLGQENIPIRITNLSLTVDDMNKALQQVGGGYLFCQLNRDGTAITVVPRAGSLWGKPGAAGRNRWVGGTGFSGNGSSGNEPGRTGRGFVHLSHTECGL